MCKLHTQLTLFFSDCATVERLYGYRHYCFRALHVGVCFIAPCPRIRTILLILSFSYRFQYNSCRVLFSSANGYPIPGNNYSYIAGIANLEGMCTYGYSVALITVSVNNKI